MSDHKAVQETAKQADRQSYRKADQDAVSLHIKIDTNDPAQTADRTGGQVWFSGDTDHRDTAGDDHDETVLTEDIHDIVPVTEPRNEQDSEDIEQDQDQKYTESINEFQ